MCAAAEAEVTPRVWQTASIATSVRTRGRVREQCLKSSQPPVAAISHNAAIIIARWKLH
jgi:hypothetical protein